MTYFRTNSISIDDADKTTTISVLSEENSCSIHKYKVPLRTSNKDDEDNIGANIECDGPCLRYVLSIEHQVSKYRLTQKKYTYIANLKELKYIVTRK